VSAVEQTARRRPVIGSGSIEFVRGLCRSPPLVFFGGVLLIALGAGLVAAHVTVFALDETLIQQSAVHYTHDFPHSLLHDLDARATNRLYSLVLSIAFRLFSDGYSSVRVDHVLSALLFVSAAIPIYLMARVVLRSQWAAVGAALLSVAAPWLTLTSTLYTENLSYPLFWWMMLATCRSVWRPSPGRDSLALLSIILLICTRVQFAAVFPGYVVALVTVGALRTSSGGVPRRVGLAMLRAARTSPLTAIALAASIAGFVYERTSSHWQLDAEKLFGTYSNVVIRNGFSSNMVEGLLIELIALALGVGLLPAIVSLVWYAKRMARPRLDQAWAFQCAAGVILLFFLVLTVFSQGGYLGSFTEERYFFYVIPVFWLGTFAALSDGGVRPGEILACAVGLAALYGAIPLVSPLTQETAFLAPAESVVPHVLVQRLNQFGLIGLTIQDTLALLTLAAGVLAAYLWRRRPAVRAWWIAGVAVVVQLLITGYAFAVITGHIHGIAGRTAGHVAPLGWVDTHTRSPRVAWLDNLSTTAPLTSRASSAEDQQRTTLFWNSSVRSWVRLPEIGLPPVEVPMVALPGAEGVSVNPRTGVLTPAAAVAGLNDVVGATDSPFLQLAGAAMARSPDRVLTLTQLAHPVRAVWVARGLGPDGGIPAVGVVRVAAFAGREPVSGQGTVLAAALRFVPPLANPRVSKPAPTLLGVRLGDARVRVELTVGGRPVLTRLVTCLTSQSRAVTGTITVRRSLGNAAAGALESVALSRGGACSPPPPEHDAQRLGGARG
jgi:hypothetical protein